MKYYNVLIGKENIGQNVLIKKKKKEMWCEVLKLIISCN